MTEVAHVGFVSLEEGSVLRNGLTGESVPLREHGVIGAKLTATSRVELCFLEGYGLLYIDDVQCGYISDVFTQAMYEESAWFFHVVAGATVWVDRNFWTVDYVRVQLTLESSTLDVTVNLFQAHIKGWLQLKYWSGFASDIGLEERLLYKKPVDVKNESIWNWGKTLLCSTTGFLVSVFHLATRSRHEKGQKLRSFALSFLQELLERIIPHGFELPLPLVKHGREVGETARRKNTCLLAVHKAHVHWHCLDSMPNKLQHDIWKELRKKQAPEPVGIATLLETIAGAGKPLRFVVGHVLVELGLLFDDFLAAHAQPTSMHLTPSTRKRKRHHSASFEDTQDRLALGERIDEVAAPLDTSQSMQSLDEFEEEIQESTEVLGPQTMASSSKKGRELSGATSTRVAMGLRLIRPYDLHK
eukprot:6459352-Amphidinium_carterae.2